MEAIFTPLKALAASALWIAVASAAPDVYQTELPGSIAGTKGPTVMGYKSPRFNFSDRKVYVKEPKFSRQQYLFAKEAFVSEKRDEAIKLLRQQFDSGYQRNRDNMLLRLGQLYAEKYMELSYRENELYSHQLQEYEKLKSSRPNLKPPKADTRRSQRYLQEALSLFYRLEREYPKHERLDEVLFFIGFVEMESGKGPKGSKYLERLIQNYPSSRKFDEAAVYLADYYFEKHKFKDAMEKYRLILRKKDNPLYHYALYKNAWCELNTDHEEKALSDMKALVAALEGAKEPAKFNLREQALRDLVLFYGQVGQVDEAYAYFTTKVGKQKALENLRLIADILKAKARDHEAISAYTKLLEAYGDTIEAPKLQLGLYESLARLGRVDAAIDVLVKAIERYGAQSGWGKQFPKEKQGEVKAILDTLQSEAKKVAFFYHHAGQKSTNKAFFNYALRIYAALLRQFPEHPDRKKLAFYQGEILFNQKKWLEAASHYLEAAKIPPKDKLADESIYNALLALDRLTSTSDTLERLTKEQLKKPNLTPAPMPDTERKFIELAETYLKEYPQGSKVVDVRFRIGVIYFKYRHYDQAAELFQEIATKHPRHSAARTAAYLTIDILNMKKDYDALSAAATTYLNIASLGDSKFKNDMAVIKGEIGFKKIEPLEAQGKWSEAATAYLSFYRDNPKNAAAELALYNAFVSHEKANETLKAAEVARLFIQRYPNHEYTQRLTLSLAKLSEKLHQYEESQRLYQAYHRKYPKDKEARKALYNAALFAELLEKNTEALELYDEYSRTGRVAQDEARAIEISRAKIYRKLGKIDKMASVYRGLIRDSKTAADRIALLGELARQYERAGKLSDRDLVVNEIRALYEGAPNLKDAGPAIQYVAEGKFKSIQRLRAKYEEIQLRFPPEDLLYLMRRKQRQLVKLSEAYDAVVSVGVPEWGVAALHEKSVVYDQFVQSYRTVQIPKKYKGKEREEVEKQLKQIDDQLVAPLASKAQEVLKLCVEKAAEFAVTSEYSVKCQRGLKDSKVAAVRPRGEYPRFPKEIDVLVGVNIPKREASDRLQALDREKWDEASDRDKVLQYAALLNHAHRARDASRLLEKLLVRSGDDKAAIFLLAIAENQQGRRELASYLFGRLEKVSFEWPSLLLAQRGLWALSDKNRSLAMDHLDRATKSVPPLAMAYRALGSLNLESNNYREAERLFAKAFDIEPESQDSVLGLGVSLEGQGKAEDAHRVYSTFLDHFSRSPDVLFSDALVLGGVLGRKEEAREALSRYVQLGGKETAKANELLQAWR